MRSKPKPEELNSEMHRDLDVSFGAQFGMHNRRKQSGFERMATPEVFGKTNQAFTDALAVRNFKATLVAAKQLAAGRELILQNFP